MCKARKGMQFGNLEKKLGVPTGSFRHPSGRETREDKTLGAMRRENKEWRIARNGLTNPKGN